MTNLKVFELHVNKTGVSDEGLLAVFKSVKFLTNLTTLSLALSEVTIDKDETLEALAKPVSDLNQLTEFSFIGFKTNISDKGFSALMESL